MSTLSEYCKLHGLECHFHSIDTTQYVTVSGGSDLDLLTSRVVRVYTVIVQHYYPQAELALPMIDEAVFDLGTVFDLIKYSASSDAILASPKIIAFTLRTI